MKGCTEEIEDRPNSPLEEDTEDIRKRRGVNQEVDQCWKKLVERMEEEVLDKCKVEDSKREAYRGLFADEQHRIKKWGRLLGKNLRFVQKVQPAESAKHARRFDGRRRDEEAAKNEYYEGFDKENLQGRMDAESTWWVAEFLAADCEKAWLHPGWKISCKMV